MTHAVAKVCAAINADDAGVHLDADEMREVIDALDERERAIGRERTRADAAEAECARLRGELAAACAERDEARAVVAGRAVAPSRVALPVAAPAYEHPGCHSDDDGHCEWAECPQIRDNEPHATGRHCPRDLRGDE